MSTEIFYASSEIVLDEIALRGFAAPRKMAAKLMPCFKY